MIKFEEMDARSQINIAILEDDIVIRKGLEQFFMSQNTFNKVIAAESVEAFFEENQHQKIDVVLIDIGLPGMSGIEGIRLIKEKWSSIQILMLTVFKDSDRIFKSICAGANGYLLKGTAFPDIKQAILDVLKGGSYMSPTIARKVFEHFNPPKEKKTDLLTPRERQIVQGLVDGLSYKLLADRLSITIDTIRYHIKNIYAKLHVNSKTEVVSKSLKGEIPQK